LKESGCGAGRWNTRPREATMEILGLLGVLVLWWVLQTWILPKFGVPT
jgi:hypothetical protein